MMSAILENTKEDVRAAYEAKSLPKISKETLYVFDRVVHFMLSHFKDRLKGITCEKNEIDFDIRYLLSEKNKKHLLKTIEFLSQYPVALSALDFGKMKVDLERWYYEMGGEGIYFEYQEEYLLTTREAANRLGVSAVTLNKYVKQGLEVVDTTSHNKIPEHAIELWKDPVYVIRMQMVAQEKKRRNQRPEYRLIEVREEIMELQKKYKTKTVGDAMTAMDRSDVDTMDDPSEFRNWEDLEKEEEELLDEVIGGSNLG